jgi:DNA-binding response OmpR family regulator
VVAGLDDDLQTCLLVERTLTAAGYKVRYALNGENALRMIGERRPAVLILDLKIPGIDGFQVLERLDKLSSAPPVVVLTSLDLSPLERERIAQTVSDLVVKGPFSRKCLVSAVAQALFQEPGSATGGEN